MRAATTKGYGSNSTLVVGQAKKPVPGKYDVLVKVHASSVNPKDWKLNQNITSVVPDIGPLRPCIMGDDLSGEVVEVGAKVEGFAVGDEVYGMDMRLRTTACAEFAIINSKRIAHKPKNISHAEAAGVPLAAQTALQGFRLAKLKPGQRVLIIGASGGVGTFAVQIAKALGAHVTGVCSGRNIKLVKSLGADDIIDYTKEKYIEGENDFDVVFDVTSYESPKSCESLLKEDGVFVSTMGGPKALLDVQLDRFKFRKQTAKMVVVESYTRDLEQLKEMIESGQVKVIVDCEYPLSDINDAYVYSRSGRAKGKIIIKI